MDRFKSYIKQRAEKILISFSLSSMPKRIKKYKPTEQYRKIFIGDRIMVSYLYTDSDGEDFPALQTSLQKCRKLKNNYLKTKHDSGQYIDYRLSHERS